MNQQQRKKILVLGAFVIVLALASWYLYNLLVKTSPYYPKEGDQQEQVDQ